MYIIVIITDNSIRCTPLRYTIILLYTATHNADDADPGGHTVFKLLQVNTINSDYWLLFGLWELYAESA